MIRFEPLATVNLRHIGNFNTVVGITGEKMILVVDFHSEDAAYAQLNHALVIQREWKSHREEVEE